MTRVANSVSAAIAALPLPVPTMRAMVVGTLRWLVWDWSALARPRAQSQLQPKPR